MSSAELELQLQALAAEIEYPPTPDLVPGIRAGLERPRRPRRRWLVIALAVLAVAVAGVVAVPSARSSIEHWLGFGAVRVDFVDRLPERPLTGDPNLGTTMALQDARDRAAFRIVVPPADLGNPTLYFRGNPPRGGLVSFVYGNDRRARMILSELRGDYRPYIQKTIGEAAVVTETEVNGRPALFLDGAHYVEFADATGRFSFEPVRLAGKVLLWNRGDVTFRLEGDLTLEQALEVAKSMH